MPFDFQFIGKVQDLVIVEPERFADDRGWFMETYKRDAFEEAGIPHTFVQDNHSRSTWKGVLRGLHYQCEPRPQGKLVRCTRGRVFDVAVDIREGSPTYKQWAGVELGEDNARQLWIPPGFAHGFCTLTEIADVCYKLTNPYDPDLDSGFAWDDPEIGVDWPVEDPILSEKDAAAPLLADSDANFTYQAEAQSR